MLQDDGWRLHATRGSHRQFKHPTKSGRLQYPGNRVMILPSALSVAFSNKPD
jgi:predicted RNA binding protein YcfA (HicA-like mRNA interferase family)